MKYYQNIFMVTSHYVIEYCSRFLDFSDREPANKLDFPGNIKTKKKKGLKLAIHSSETVIIKLKLQCNLSLSKFLIADSLVNIQPKFGPLRMFDL